MTQVLVLALGSLAVVLAPQADGPSGTKRAQPPPARPSPANDDRQNQPTAEDILKALQRKRPANAVIPPASAATRDHQVPRATVVERRALLPEGVSIVSRSGRLAREGQWWTFVFDPADDGQTPLRLLPNAPLEQAVRTLTGAPSPMGFVVSGEVTVFQGENYLLVRSAMRTVTTDAAAPLPPEPSSRPASDAPAEDVLDVLRMQQPREAMLPVGGASSDDLFPHAGSASRTLALEGTPLVNRPGRLIRRGPWWTLVSESDHPEFPEPPLKLLPSQGVEMMVRESERGNNGLVFVVSGEITLFAGENFLLPRSVTRRVDTGNLRR